MIDRGRQLCRFPKPMQPDMVKHEPLKIAKRTKNENLAALTHCLDASREDHFASLNLLAGRRTAVRIASVADDASVAPETLPTCTCLKISTQDRTCTCDV